MERVRTNNTELGETEMREHCRTTCDIKRKAIGSLEAAEKRFFQ